MTTILSFLRVRRLASGVTMQEAAQAAGINYGAYRKIETLAVKPSKRVEAHIAHKYGVPASRLLQAVKA